MENIFVRTTKDQLRPWNKQAIVDQLIRETSSLEEFSGFSGIKKDEAEEIASEVEKRINFKKHQIINASLVREIVNQILLEKSQKVRSKEGIRKYDAWRRMCSRVGLPVYDAYLIDIGDPNSFERSENANVQGTPETSHKKKADALSKSQALSVLPPHLADMHLKGDLHIGDMEYFTTRPFCMDYDLRFFWRYGLRPDGNGKRASTAGPAMKPEVAILHAIKVLAAGQTNCAGGQGIYNFLTFVSPYLRGLSYKMIKQLMQMLIYEATQCYVARGGQLVFSSLQLSPGVPKIWKDRSIVYQGKVWNNLTYGDFEQEVQDGFKAIMEVMLQGDHIGRPFSFPKPEIDMQPDFMNKSEYDDLYRLSTQLAAKFGTPYFDNQMPEYRGSGEGISCFQCCSYHFASDKESDDEFEQKMNFEDNKHFSMGGWQVISINSPRLAYLANGNDQTLFDLHKQRMDTAIEIFKVKQNLMNKVLKADRLPFLTQRFGDGTALVDLNDLVYTIGVVGINEMVQFHTGSQLHESPDAMKLAIRTLYEMKAYARELEEKHGITLAVARTPAESVSQKFPVADLIHYPEQAKQVVKGDLQTALHLNSNDLPVYYSNGSHYYVGAPITLAQKINGEQTFFPILDGGNIFHAFLGEKNPDPDALHDFVIRVAKNTNIGYFAVTKDMTMCGSCNHVDQGLSKSCSFCGSQNVDWLSRVTGYLQAVSGWNAGKKQELMDRRRYNLGEI